MNLKFRHLLLTALAVILIILLLTSAWDTPPQAKAHLEPTATVTPSCPGTLIFEDEQVLLTSDNHGNPVYLKVKKISDREDFATLIGSIEYPPDSGKLVEIQPHASILKDGQVRLGWRGVEVLVTKCSTFLPYRYEINKSPKP